MKSGTLWVVIAALALTVAPGCGDDGDTVIVGVRYPGNFPGNSVDDNNHARDAKAFSENGEELGDGPRVFYSSRSNRAIIVYTTVASMGMGPVTLWASYFDGKKVTPPVEITPVSSLGKQGDFWDYISIDAVVVMFYAPSNDPANRDTTRDGDAVILFACRDVDDSGPSLPNDSNRRLWWCYFDRSLASQASQAHGFGTFEAAGDFRPGFADIVDSDDGENDNTNQTTPYDDKQSDSVEAFGVVSDGLHGEGVFGPGGNFYNQTDFQDYLVATWVQFDEVNSSATGDTVDLHLWWSRFDITSDPPGFTTPQRIMSDTSSPENGGGAFVEADTINLPILAATNNSLVYFIQEFPDGDDVVEYNHYQGDFTTGTFFGNSVEVSPTNDPSDFDFPYWTDLPMLYGEDHNLVDVVLFFGYNSMAGGDWDEDIFLARFDPTALSGSAAFNATNDRVQVDNTGVNPPNPSDAYDWETVISRDSDYILLGFMQWDDTTFDQELWLLRYVTDEIGGTPVGGPISNSIGSPIDATDSSIDWDVLSWDFQRELAFYFIPPNGAVARGIYHAGIQSDNDHMHVIWELNDDFVGPTPLDRLHVSQYEYMGLLSDGSVTYAELDDFPDMRFDSMGEVEDRTRVLDNGDGGVVIYYIRNDNYTSTTLDPVNRLKARNFDGLSMSGALDLNSPNLQVEGDDFEAITLGADDPAANIHFVFFAEDRYAYWPGPGPDSSVAARMRRFDKLDTGTPFTIAQFGPIHTVDTGQSVDAMVMGGTTTGGTANIAIYMIQGGHFYYNEYTASTDTWKDASDFIIDNDSAENVDDAMMTAFRPFLTPDMMISGETAGALAFWWRADTDGETRLYLRIHK